MSIDRIFLFCYFYRALQAEEPMDAQSDMMVAYDVFKPPHPKK